MADLSVTVDGLRLPNPFIIASGPPGTNANVIARAFDEGWGAVIAKTVCLEAEKIVNVAPRYARMRVGRKIVGWENIELISDRPIEVWEEEFRRLKGEYPDRVLIASIMEECRRERWVEIVRRCEAAGVDGFELNFSCPHGLPERKMGSAMGQDPELLEEICGWVRSATDLPVWAKMTPNITRIEEPARAALKGGCSGVSAINTILAVMGIDLKTLRPEPTVEGYSIPGGYSAGAIRPIALRMVMECARMMSAEFPAAPAAPGRSSGGGARVNGNGHRHAGPQLSARSLSGIGGIETGEDAAQYLLLGANTVQVCTGVMIHGYGLIHELKRGLERFMEAHGFERIEDFRGHSLRYFTTHADLVERQAEARARRDAAAGEIVIEDTDWQGDRFVEQSEGLVAGNGRR